MEKKYIELKRRIVYRGQVYDALESERIKSLSNFSTPYYDGYADGLKKAIQILANDVQDVPAADVRPVVRGTWKHVKWAKDEDFQEGGYWISRCSNCSMPYHNETPFCPHCGADMRGK